MCEKSAVPRKNGGMVREKKNIQSGSSCLEGSMINLLTWICILGDFLLRRKGSHGMKITIFHSPPFFENFVGTQGSKKHIQGQHWEQWFFEQKWGGSTSIQTPWTMSVTLPESNIFAEDRPKPKRKFIFQPSIFRCELLVSGRVTPREQIHVGNGHDFRGRPSTITSSHRVTGMPRLHQIFCCGSSLSMYQTGSNTIFTNPGNSQIWYDMVYLGLL